MVGSSLYSFPLYVLRLCKRLFCQATVGESYMLRPVGAPSHQQACSRGDTAILPSAMNGQHFILRWGQQLECNMCHIR